MYNSPFYEQFVANPYASQIGVSSRYPLPTAAAQSAAESTAEQNSAAGRVWICTSANCACGQVNCYPLRRPCCCGCSD